MSYGTKTGPEEPILPPIEFDPPSNGEYCPAGPTEVGQRRYELWKRLVEEKHRRLGMSRRAFAESACGMAAWMFVINQIGCGGDGSGSGTGGSGAGTGGAGARGGAGGSGGSGTAGSGGSGAGGSGAGGSSPSPDALGGDVAGYDVRPDMMDDLAAAREALGGDEFIFDVQTHIVDPEMLWQGARPPENILNYLKLIFVDSPTTVACLSGVPNTRNQGISSIRAREQIRQIVERYGGQRMLFHCNTNPLLMGEADYMAEAAMMNKNIAAWKTYPQNNPGGLAADNIVSTFIRSARETGVKIIASHRGLDSSGYNASGSPLDVVRAAKMAPDLKFLVYHGGWQGSDEGPYDPNAASAGLTGVNRFIRAMEENQLPPNSNVYAELGTTWRNLSVAANMTQAAHALGKLLKYVGVDRVCYGTDCVMGGSPNGQIMAMRRFVIPEALQQAHGYPAITDEVRRKILGLNGAGAYGIDPARMRYRVKDDDLAQLRMARLEDPRAVPMPDRRLYEGPRTRREFFAWRKRERALGGHHG